DLDCWSSWTSYILTQLQIMVGLSLFDGSNDFYFHTDCIMGGSIRLGNGYIDRSALLYLILANETLQDLYPNIITIAEDVSRLGFDYYVNPRASDMWLSFLVDVKDFNWSMSKIVDTLVGIKGSFDKMLLYSENHNQVNSRPHPESSTTPASSIYFIQFYLKRGGQIVATMLMYLTDNVEGGETFFPMCAAHTTTGPVCCLPTLLVYVMYNKKKDKALQDFVQDQWLCDTANGKFGLGVRSSLDLWSWFHNNEVPLCDACNEAGIKKAYKTRERNEGSCHSLSISMAKGKMSRMSQ
ncbi:1,4-alpha-glucan-branching enzyme 3, chloroplastic/amyloplastic, partial [Tanacetum coccineum]